MMRFFWISAGLIALAVGIAGIILPLVPTVPLVLLASFVLRNRLNAYTAG